VRLGDQRCCVCVCVCVLQLLQVHGLISASHCRSSPIPTQRYMYLLCNFEKQVGTKVLSMQPIIEPS
jgi:hypothetical protein